MFFFKILGFLTFNPVLLFCTIFVFLYLLFLKLKNLILLKMQQISFNNNEALGIGPLFYNTSPFLPVKGYIVRYNDSIIPFYFRLAAKRFLITHNHLSIYNNDDNNNSDITDLKSRSRVVKFKQIIAEIKEMKDEVKTIPRSQIQFWIRPYIHNKNNIIIYSHDENDHFSFSYKKGSENNIVKRLSVSGRFNKKIFKILRKVEKYHNSAVKITVCKNFLRGLVIVDVEKINSQPYSLQKEMIRNLFLPSTISENNSFFKNLSSEKNNLLSSICGYEILFEKNKVFSSKINNHPFEISSVSSVINDLKKLYKDVLIERKCDNCLLNEIKNILKPIIKMRLSNELSFKNSLYSIINTDLFNTLKQENMTDKYIKIFNEENRLPNQISHSHTLLFQKILAFALIIYFENKNEFESINNAIKNNQISCFVYRDSVDDVEIF